MCRIFQLFYQQQAYESPARVLEVPLYIEKSFHSHYRLNELFCRCHASEPVSAQAFDRTHKRGFSLECELLECAFSSVAPVTTFRHIFRRYDFLGFFPWGFYLFSIIVIQCFFIVYFYLFSFPLLQQFHQLHICEITVIAWINLLRF